MKLINHSKYKDGDFLSGFTIIGGLLTLALILSVVILITLKIQFLVIFCVSLSGILSVSLYFGIGSCVKMIQFLEKEIEEFKKKQSK